MWQRIAICTVLCVCVTRSCTAGTERPTTTVPDSHFLTDVGLPSVSSIEDLRSMILSAVLISSDTQDPKLAKQDILDPGHPLALVVSTREPAPRDLEVLATVVSGSTEASLVLSPDLGKLIDKNAAEHGRPSYPCPVLAARRIDAANRQAEESNPPDGLYLFNDQRTLIWYAASADWPSLTSEVRIVLRTLEASRLGNRRTRVRANNSGKTTGTPPNTVATPKTTGVPPQTTGSTPKSTPRTTPPVHPQQENAIGKTLLSKLMTIPVKREVSKRVRLKDILDEKDDSPVLVGFWATWCTPCRLEFPAVGQLIEAKDTELRYVGILTDGTSSSARTAITKIVPEPLRDSQYILADVKPLNTILSETYEYSGQIKVPLFVLLGANGQVLFKCNCNITEPPDSDDFNAALRLDSSRRHRR
jgi:thiol-disulfide isomerase/thioredoxin